MKNYKISNLQRLSHCSLKSGCVRREKLCCIFNYAPLYRKSIYQKIDDAFDAAFYFGDMKSGIAKMNYDDFKKQPVKIRDRKIFGKLLWRRDIMWLPFKPYNHFLIIGDSSLSYLPFILFCKIFGKKVYAWGHGCKSFEGKMKWFNKWFYKNCDVFFTYSEGGRSRLVELGIPKEKLHVIYNSLNSGVDPESQLEYESDILKKHFTNELPILLFIGRLTKVKQLDWLITAQKLHETQGLLYNILIIGKGEEVENLKEMVRMNELSERVWFYGECYNEDELSYLLYNSDLCVSPGNVGLTALHAMSYGTPVLSHGDFETQMPEYEAIIPGKTGELYVKGNFEDFCQKIELWLSNNKSRKQIRQNCYDIINGRFNSIYQIELLKRIINTE